MSQNIGVGVVGLYVRDQDEALAFYVDKLGFRVHTDAGNGDYRWLTVQHPEQRRARRRGGFAQHRPPGDDLDALCAQRRLNVIGEAADPWVAQALDEVDERGRQVTGGTLLILMTRSAR